VLTIAFGEGWGNPVCPPELCDDWEVVGGVAGVAVGDV
jgi:hypothetical protein